MFARVPNQTPVAFLAAVLLAAPCLARTWTVCSGGRCDFRSIQAAIDQARTGDTIHIASGTYVENLVINHKDLTLEGEGKYSTVIRAADTTRPVIYVVWGRAYIQHLTVMGGSRGVDMWYASADMFRCGIVSNVREGVYDLRNYRLTLTECQIKDNGGDGILVEDSQPDFQLRIYNCQIERNRGAGIRVRNSARGFSGSVNANTIANNSIGISADASSPLTGAGNGFTGNGTDIEGSGAQEVNRGTNVSRPCRPVCGDPPVWGEIIAFPTPERFLGQDLNDDGDTRDTVLRWMNLRTGEVVNTGVVVTGLSKAIAVYQSVIAFVGEGGQIRWYDTSSGKLGDVGASGTHPSIYKTIIVFDAGGHVRCYDLRTESLLPGIELAGTEPAIWGDTIVFRSGTTLWYHNLTTGKTVNTGIVGSQPQIYDNTIVFTVREYILDHDLNADGDKYDQVVGFYDLETGTVTLLSAEGEFPAVYENILVFSTQEPLTTKDLNGDGRIMGSVIRYYDLRTGELVNTGVLGTEPSIYEAIITYYVWEFWVEQDLTDDGDAIDPVLGYFWIPSWYLANVSDSEADRE